MTYKGYTVAHVPWVPTNDEVIEKVVQVLARYVSKFGPGVFADIGCGDGRVATTVAKRLQLPTICIELKYELALRARQRAEREHVGHLVEVVQGDFFTVNLSRVRYLYMYLLQSVNMKLEPKLREELPRQALIVSLDFPIPGWHSVNVVEIPHRSWQRRLYIYMKDAALPSAPVEEHRA